MKFTLCLALLGCTALSARADLSYTQTTAMSFGGMIPGGGSTTTKVAMKGNMSRMESAVMGTKTIIITNGAGVTQIDPGTKTYMVSSGAAKPIGAMPKMGAGDITVSVKKLGMDTVRGVKAPHWSIDMKIKMQSERGPRTMDMQTEIWSSTTPYPSTGGKGALGKLPLQVRAMLGNKITVKGDTKNMGAAYATVPLRMKMYMGGNSMGTTDTTNISTKNLPASLFSVPTGYRRVTEQQWGKIQRDAMMKKMGGMMKGMGR